MVYACILRNEDPNSFHRSKVTPFGKTFWRICKTRLPFLYLKKLAKQKATSTRSLKCCSMNVLKLILKIGEKQLSQNYYTTVKYWKKWRLFSNNVEQSFAKKVFWSIFKKYQKLINFYCEVFWGLWHNVWKLDLFTNAED